MPVLELMYNTDSQDGLCFDGSATFDALTSKRVIDQVRDFLNNSAKHLDEVLHAVGIFIAYGKEGQSEGSDHNVTLECLPDNSWRCQTVKNNILSVLAEGTLDECVNPFVIECLQAGDHWLED